MTSGVPRTPGRNEREQSSTGRAATIAARRLAVSAFALCSASLAGCSPTQFWLREREANDALEAAEHAQALALAPYELTSARLYLAKARELAGEAHYTRAIELSERSTESALRARTLAMARATPAATRSDLNDTTAHGVDAE